MTLGALETDPPHECRVSARRKLQYGESQAQESRSLASTPSSRAALVVHTFPPIERCSQRTWRCQRVGYATLRQGFWCPAREARDLIAALDANLGSKKGTCSSMT